ncbi:MAG TPA: NAD-dependent epimerase/dehydratase family protein, partial [Candidatus Polarisedimenticolia bacterium]|nr:NAD-dependent epimerase/dehydratase family protein [Candidatus Polarisedimenticolia bacterium]
VLISAGHRVTLFNRGRTPDPFGAGVERLRGDRRSAADMSSGLSGREFDAVYDFLSYEAADARLAVESLHGRVGRFVHISTCSVYWCTGDFPCPVAEEDFDRLGDFAERPGSIEYDYGYAKRKAEETLFAAHREKGFPVTTIRIPIVGGEEDNSLRYASYVMRVSDGEPVILPDGGYAPFRHVYVGDVARMLADLPGIAGAVGQAYNLASSEILSTRMIVNEVAALLGTRVETIEIPTPLLRSLGLGTAFSPFSQQAAQIPSIGKAQRELGWAPTPYRTWLERTVRWDAEHRSSPQEPPPAYTFRALELETAERYRALIKPAVEGAGGTSAASPG